MLPETEGGRHQSGRASSVHKGEKDAQNRVPVVAAKEEAGRGKQRSQVRCPARQKS